MFSRQPPSTSSSGKNGVALPKRARRAEPALVLVLLFLVFFCFCFVSRRFHIHTSSRSPLLLFLLDLSYLSYLSATCAITRSSRFAQAFSFYTPACWPFYLLELFIPIPSCSRSKYAIPCSDFMAIGVTPTRFSHVLNRIGLCNALVRVGSRVLDADAIFGNDPKSSTSISRPFRTS